MKAWAERFYKSKQWQHCRDSYAKSAGGLCERCLSRGKVVPGRIVHHKVWLTPENINDPSVTLSWGNLELVCWECHEAEHKQTRRRYAVDEAGRVTTLGD